MSFLDQFKNSEFASVRHHATMAEQEFKAAIIVSNDILPPELQTHNCWEPSDGEDGGKFFGTDLLTIERRLATIEKQESDHVVTKRTKGERLESYAQQWDENERIEYHDDDKKLHQNSVLFLKLVLSDEEFEEFEEEVEKSIS